MAGPITAGHDASTASVGIAADQALRWGAVGPTLEYTSALPPDALIYAHHPWGIFWTTTTLVALLGRGDLVCRLAPLLLSVITPIALYVLASRLWRPAAGAAAAVIFCALPMTLAFATFNALEVPVIAWSAVALAGWIGARRDDAQLRRRDLAALGGGALLTCLADWQGMMVMAALVGGELVGAAIATQRGRPPSRRRRVLLAALAAIILVVALGHVAMFAARGLLEDLGASYGLRAAGNRTGALAAIVARRFWLETTFTPVGLVLIAIAAPLAIGRALRLRRSVELIPLALVAAATAQLLLFRQGADVHVFWPHLFVPVAALAAAALVATAARRAGTWPIALAFAVGLAGVIAVDGVRALRWARTSGGRFDEKGLLVASGADQVAALRWLAPQLPPDGLVALDPSLGPTWAHLWSLQRPTSRGAPLGAGRCDGSHLDAAGSIAWVGDLRYLAEDQLRSAAARCALRVVGPLAIATPGVWQPLTAFRVEETAATGLRGWLVEGAQPARRVVPDPWGTWELRRHLGEPTPAPADPPRTADELRIAHNAVLDAGDPVAARRHLAALLEDARALDAAFDDGTELLAIRHEVPRAPGSTVTLLVRAGGPLDPGVALAVRGKVIARARGALTMPDPKPRELALAPRIPVQLWKPGWLYAIELARPLRPGREELRASFRATRFPARVPRAADGTRDVMLVRE